MSASVRVWERESVGTWRRGATRYALTLSRWYALTCILLLAAGCRQDMHDQPKYKPLKSSAFFEDGRDSRPLVADTVARGHLDADALLYTGKVGTAFADDFPFPVTRDVLARGQERFNIYCSPCHDRTGSGTGMIVRRGYRRPPSFHIDRLRAAPAGYFFDVVTHGFGAMPDYASQVPVADRWAIVSYIRVLQLSQHATLADVPDAQRSKLMASHE
jgi:mono/diheme cytochrome c family protein